LGHSDIRHALSFGEDVQDQRGETQVAQGDHIGHAMLCTVIRGLPSSIGHRPDFAAKNAVFGSER